MITTLTPHEHGWALVLDAAQLELLKLDPKKPLIISSEGQTITMVPMSEENAGETFRDALDDVNEKFGRVLKRLA